MHTPNRPRDLHQATTSASEDVSSEHMQQIDWDKHSTRDSTGLAAEIPSPSHQPSLYAALQIEPNETSTITTTTPGIRSIGAPDTLAGWRSIHDTTVP